MNSLDILMHRHSVPARQLGAPAPDEATLRTMLEAAIRVPDHGKLVPFRLVLLRGEAKLAFGQRLAELAIGKHPDMPASKQEKERQRIERAGGTAAYLRILQCMQAKAGQMIPRQAKMRHPRRSTSPTSAA